MTEKAVLVMTVKGYLRNDSLFSVITRLAKQAEVISFFVTGDTKTRLLRDFVPRNDGEESPRNDEADGSLRGIRQDAEAISEISTLSLTTGGS
ncbi:hypothetical protein JCM13991_15160 [Thermodesulfovibrio hydrogeniphilus]